MDDNILKPLKDAYDGYEIGKYLRDLFIGDELEKIEDIEKGLEHLDRINSNENREYHAKEAFAYFKKIDDYDKKYLRAYQLYGKASCYYFLFLFDDAISELNKLNEINVTYGTSNKKLINEIQSEGRKLRESIYEIRKKNEENERKKKIRRKKIIITTVVIIAIILCIVIYNYIIN